MKINGNHRFRQRNYKVCTPETGTHLKQIHYWEDETKIEIIKNLVAGKLLNGKAMTVSDYFKIISDFDLYKRGLLDQPKNLIVEDVTYKNVFDMPLQRSLKKPI